MTVSRLVSAPKPLVTAAAIISGPAVISLVAVGIAPSMPAMAAAFASRLPPWMDAALFSQLVATVPAAVLVVSAPFAGLLASLWGRRRVLMAASLLFVASGIAPLFAWDVVSLLASRVLLGVASATILATSLSLAGDLPAGGYRERVLGFMVGGSAVSATLVLLYGGRLVDSAGWRAPFALYAAGLATLILAWRGVAHHARLAVTTPPVTDALRMFWPLYLLVALLGVGMFMPVLQGPFLLAERGAASAATAGQVIAAASMASFFSASCYGWATRRYCPRVIVAFTCFTYGLGLAVMASAGASPPVAAVGSAIVGLGSGWVEPMGGTTVLARAERMLQPAAAGMLISALFFGQFLNPMLVAPLHATAGLAHAFMALALVFTLVGVCYLSGITLREHSTTRV